MGSDRRGIRDLQELDFFIVMWCSLHSSVHFVETEIHMSVYLSALNFNGKFTFKT